MQKSYARHITKAFIFLAGGLLMMTAAYILFLQMATIHLLITGKVQGVFYRASAKEKAVTLGVTGWVKNIKGGAVECTASGDRKALDLFVAWCKMGPPAAVVDAVKVNETEEKIFPDFVVLRG